MIIIIIIGHNNANNHNHNKKKNKWYNVKVLWLHHRISASININAAVF